MGGGSVAREEASGVNSVRTTLWVRGDAEW